MPPINTGITLGGNFGIQPLNLQGVLGINLGGTLAVKGIGLDDIKINNLPVIRLDTIKIDPLTVDVGLDNIRIKELPKIELEIGLKPVRVHVPSHYQVCLSLLGKEVFKLAFCGETMVATEPYCPHQTENCG